jgi:hypothetical protein
MNNKEPDNPLDKLFQDQDQGYAYVSYAVGGSLSQISFEQSKAKEASKPKEASEAKNRTATPRGGGLRGTVKGFSWASRINLLRRMARINRSAFRENEGRVFALTLTYPHEWPEDPAVCKRHLKALRKRLQREFGEFSAFWRLGLQKRGAWHFHLLLFVPPSFGSLKELRHFIAHSWHEICGRISEGHLQAGTHVEEVRSWRSATSRMEKYVAKPEQFPEGVVTGRCWGVWNEDLLPVQWETVKVSRKDAFQIRRFYRRLAGLKSYGSLRRVTVFIEHKKVLSLLESLGYRQDEEPRTPIDRHSRKRCSRHPVKSVAAQGAPRILGVPKTVGFWNTAASYALAVARRTFSIVRKALHFTAWRRTLREGEKGGLMLVEGAEPSWWHESDLFKGLPKPDEVERWWEVLPKPVDTVDSEVKEEEKPIDKPNEASIIGVDSTVDASTQTSTPGIDNGKSIDTPNADKDTLASTVSTPPSRNGSDPKRKETQLGSYEYIG